MSPSATRCRGAAHAVLRCDRSALPALPIPALSRPCLERGGERPGRAGGVRDRSAPPGAAAAHLGILKGCGFFFTFPQCHDFRFPPSKKKKKSSPEPSAPQPAAAAMEEPEANAEPPPPGLRSLLPPREFLCSRKGQLLLAESVRAAGGRLSGDRRAAGRGGERQRRCGPAGLEGRGWRPGTARSEAKIRLKTPGFVARTLTRKPDPCTSTVWEGRRIPAWAGGIYGSNWNSGRGAVGLMAQPAAPQGTPRPLQGPPPRSYSTRG